MRVSTDGRTSPPGPAGASARISAPARSCPAGVRAAVKWRSTLPRCPRSSTAASLSVYSPGSSVNVPMYSWRPPTAAAEAAGPLTSGADDGAVRVGEGEAAGQGAGGHRAVDLGRDHEPHLPWSPGSVNVATRIGSSVASSGVRRNLGQHVAGRARPGVASGQEVPPRAHLHARPPHVHVDPVDAAVLVAGLRLEAEQVVAGDLARDAVEGLAGAGHDGEQPPAGGAHEHLEPLAPQQAVVVEGRRHIGSPTRPCAAGRGRPRKSSCRPPPRRRRPAG